MGIIDLPNTWGFQGAQFSLGLDVSESTFTGFLTGNRTRSSNLADRLRGVLTLPPTRNRTVAAARESLLMGMRSRGDWLRFPMPHRSLPLGAFGGTVTTSASAAAGARSLLLTGVRPAPNQLQGGGFEMDSNSDGIADGWSAYASGSTGTVTRGRTATPLVDGASGMFFQYVEGSALNGAVGVASAVFPVTALAPYTLSADVQSSTNGNPQFAMAWLDAGSAYITEMNSGPLAFDRARRSVSGVAPSNAVSAQVVLYVASTSSALVRLNLDNVQVERSAVLTAYAGLAAATAGDWLGIGGNLLQVAYGGAVANDMGAMTLPLSMPLPKAVASGAAVTWAAPAGLWELDDDGIQLDYSARNVQGGIAIPVRQVVQ